MFLQRKTELVYDNNLIFPIEFEMMTLKTGLEVNLDLTATQKHRLEQLNELEDMCLVVAMH